MTIHGNELRTMFWEAVPREYMRRSVKVLADCYARAAMFCTTVLEMEDSEADNTRWSIRRGLIEGGLRKIIIPPMRAEVVWGRDSAMPQPWNHTAIIAGNVRMTQLSAQAYDQSPRQSHSREMYALKNQQRFLFPEVEPEEQVNTNPLYSILLHGRDRRMPGQVGFAYVRFPKPGAQEWYAETIDLLAEFSQIALTDSGRIDLAPEEPIADPQDPEIRKQSDTA